ncbi:ParA family protein [Oceanibacterium hippocampi]|uniref:Sporulation initiation inhibitor protein Soj n=1 Tax=Oceanibacterium hippocampi TaxID=745714 RepID=A0A1Y5U5Q5_9PROT|nr:AAA family ATPase [Oceanibacterium hippocampi]SLN77727.1 Sporulation initiation inhibitor protein Soj [Oceanibacterium hippocampi]
MIYLAVHNMKGGVGKTATAVNLAYLAADEGARVLLWDLDPQGASSFYLRIRDKVKGGARKLIQGKKDLLSLVKATDFERFDLLPADMSYRNFDILLDAEKKSTRRLRQLMKPLGNDYDIVLLDCPPGLTLLSENILRAADAIIVPLIPTTLSIRSHEQTVEFCRENDIRTPNFLPFFSMVDRRKKLHRELTQDETRKALGILSSAIPYSSDIERMGIERAPVPAFAPRTTAAGCYRALWREIRDRLPARTRRA